MFANIRWTDQQLIPVIFPVGDLIVGLSACPAATLMQYVGCQTVIYIVLEIYGLIAGKNETANKKWSTRRLIYLAPTIAKNEIDFKEQ